MIRARYREEIAKALVEWAGSPARWGIDDCALALADIDVIVQQQDPAKPYRRRYRTERGARRVLGKRGLLGAWGSAARRLGWRRMQKTEFASAKDGDRAVAVTPAGVSTVIRYRGRWFGRIDYGNLMVMDRYIVRAWSVC